MSTPSRPSSLAWLSPWRTGDLVGLIAVLVVGGALLTAASVGSGGTVRTSHQMAWLTVGLAGIVVSGVGVTAWGLAGRRRIGRRRMVLLPDVAELVLDVPSTAIDVVGEGRGQGMVVVHRGTHYHRAECPAVAGKDVQAVGAVAGRTPCAICRPDGRQGEARR